MANPLPVSFNPVFRNHAPIAWKAEDSPFLAAGEDLSACLQNLDNPIYILENEQNLYISNQGSFSPLESPWKILAFSFPYNAGLLGDQTFIRTYGLRYALYGGAMANGISSEEFVISLGKCGIYGILWRRWIVAG